MARVSDMARKFAEYTGLSLSRATKQWTDISKFIRDMLLNGEDITINGVGKLTVKVRKGRNYNNPTTGEALYVPDHYVPNCIFSVGLKNEIRDKLSRPDDTTSV